MSDRSDLFKMAARLVDKREDELEIKRGTVLSRALTVSKERIERVFRERIERHLETSEKVSIETKLDGVLYSENRDIFSIIYLVRVGDDVPVVVRSDWYPSETFGEHTSEERLLVRCPRCGAHSWEHLSDMWPEMVVHGKECPRCQSLGINLSDMVDKEAVE